MFPLLSCPYLVFPVPVLVQVLSLVQLSRSVFDYSSPVSVLLVWFPSILKPWFSPCLMSGLECQSSFGVCPSVSPAFPKFCLIKSMFQEFLASLFLWLLRTVTIIQKLCMCAFIYLFVYVRIYTWLQFLMLGAIEQTSQINIHYSLIAFEMLVLIFLWFIYTK